eukprot:3477524-Lingulodinium_polyedra.AAC.1
MMLLACPIPPVLPAEELVGILTITTKQKPTSGDEPYKFCVKIRHNIVRAGARVGYPDERRA